MLFGARLPNDGKQVPNPDAHLQYKQLLERYRAVYPALKPLFHDKVCIWSKFQLSGPVVASLSILLRDLSSVEVRH